MDKQNAQPDHIDTALNIVIDGYVHEDGAQHLSTLDEETRSLIAEDLDSLNDILDSEGQVERLRWLRRQLGKAVIDSDMFVRYTSEKRMTNYRVGLGGRPWTNGRHSSVSTMSSTITQI